MPGYPAIVCCCNKPVLCLTLDPFTRVTVNGMEMTRYSPANTAPLEYDSDPGYIATNLYMDEVWYLEQESTRYFFSRNIIFDDIDDEEIIGQTFVAQVSTVSFDKGAGLPCEEPEVLKLPGRFEMEIQSETYRAYV